MNDQIRGAILSAIASLMGWLAVTSVSLLVQVSALNTTTNALKEDLIDNTNRDIRIEERLKQDIGHLQSLLERYHGPK
jgi:hypothetical protein